MIVSAGEVLMDVLPAGLIAGEPVFRTAVGGSPFNVARMLGRLGLPSAFMGAVSRDAFGHRIMAAMDDGGVMSALVARVDRPTPLAIVTYDGPDARYAFYDAGTAARGMTLRELPPLPNEARIFHFGSIALAAEPAASTLMARARIARDERIVSIDPNVRPGFAADAAVYRRNLLQAMELAHIVKLSAEDLAWLAPGAAAEQFARERLEAGALLVAVTRGADGALVYTRDAAITVAAAAVAVVDTVGAGDAFTAGLLAALYEADVRTPRALAQCGAAVIHDAMALASRVAAAVCAHPGANPPDDVVLR